MNEELDFLTQQNLLWKYTSSLTELLNSSEIKPKKPFYLDEITSPENLFKSHLERCDSSINIENFYSYSKFTYNKLRENLNIPKEILNGNFPIRVAPGMSSFYSAMIKELNAPPFVAVYIQTLRTLIGLCDNYIDKEGIYYKYKDLLPLLSHFQRDIGEYILITQAKNKIPSMSKLFKGLLNCLYNSENKDKKGLKRLILKSEPQGYVFACMAGLFSPLPEKDIYQIAEISGNYDLTIHLVGELFDMFIDKPEDNCFHQQKVGIRKAIILIYETFEDTLKMCKQRKHLKAVIINEGKLIKEALSDPRVFEEHIFRRAESKKPVMEKLPFYI